MCLLRELGLSPAAALDKYNLAPLETRRDIVMLAVLHKVVIGVAPPQLVALLPKAPLSEAVRVRTRLTIWRHNHQFDVLKRSLFGYVAVYNLLPCAVVESSTVSIFNFRHKVGSRKHHRLASTIGTACFTQKQVRSGLQRSKFFLLVPHGCFLFLFA